MSRIAQTPRFRARAVVIGVVIAGHVATLVLLTSERARHDRIAPEAQMTLVFIDSALDAAPATSAQAPRLAARRARARSAPRPADTPRAPQPSPDGESAVSAPTGIPPAVDWYSGATAAAQRAIEPQTTRNFGPPPRKPASRGKKEFHWDKTHTERVHALDGGGIGVRLSDNCELVIAPFPMAGCALGKRRARGDLFDEMKAPGD